MNYRSFAWCSSNHNFNLSNKINKINKINKKITVYTFGCPRCVSELISNQISNDLRINFYRIVNIEDNMLPSVPSSTSIPIFKHVGNLINYSYFGKSSGENHGFI